MDPVTALIGAIAAIGGAGIMAGSQESTNQTNLKMMREQNQFNAEQAQLSRDWQEEQYLKYSSPSALVQQYQQAGINPAMVSKHGQGVVFSGSTAQAGNAIPAQNPFAGLSGLGPQIVNMIDSLKNNASMRNLQKEQSETEQAKQDNLAAETAGKLIDNENLSTHWQKQFAEIDQRIENLKSEKERTEAQTALATADALLKEAQEDNEIFKSLKSNEEYLKEKWQNEFRKKNGYSPDTPLWNSIPTYLSSVFNEMNISTFGYKEIIAKARDQLRKLKDKL